MLDEVDGFIDEEPERKELASIQEKKKATLERVNECGELANVEEPNDEVSPGSPMKSMKEEEKKRVTGVKRG